MFVFKTCFLSLSFRTMVWHVSKVSAAHSPELQSLHLFPRWPPSRIPEPGIKFRHLSMWIKLSINMYIYQWKNLLAVCVQIKTPFIIIMEGLPFRYEQTYLENFKISSFTFSPLCDLSITVWRKMLQVLCIEILYFTKDIY